MKKSWLPSFLARVLIGVVVVATIAGAGIGLWQSFAEGYAGWSSVLFWRVVAEGSQTGAWMSLALGLLAIVQTLVFRLFWPTRRAAVALLAGWLMAVPILLALMVVLRALLESTPAAKLPLFAADAVSMQVFIGRILAGALLPNRLLPLIAVQPLVLLVPLLAPSALGALVSVLARRPLTNWLTTREPRPIHRWHWLVVVALGITVLVVPALAARQAPPKTRLPNLVLISIDTLRTDAIGAYGAALSATPNLDRLAAGGVRMATVRTPASWTLPAHAAMVTGRWPWRVGVRRVADALPRRATTLAEVLAAQGYDTHAVVTHLFVDSPYGFGQGYDQVEHPATERAADAAALALAWLRGRDRARPYFLFVHLYDPHWPWDPRGEVPSALFGETTLAERVRVQEFTDYFDLAQALRQGSPNMTAAARALYLSEVVGADRAAGQVLDAARAGEANTIVAVVSDHGDLFGEHGMYGHGITLFEPEIRVPWIIAGPGLPAGTTVDGAASLVDVAPTLLGLVGLPGGLKQADGQDLSAALRGAGSMPTARWLGGENLFVTATPSRYVTDGRWKWFGGVTVKIKDAHLAFASLLVRIDQDPGELQNLSDQAMEARIRQIAGLMFAGAGQTDRDVKLTEEEKQKLQSLGYLPAH